MTGTRYRVGAWLCCLALAACEPPASDGQGALEGVEESSASRRTFGAHFRSGDWARVCQTGGQGLR